MHPHHEFDPDAPADGEGGLFGLPHSLDEAAVVVVPVPFEATTSYRRGTGSAPPAILEASRQVDLHDLETGDPWKHGIAMCPVDPRIAELGTSVEADALAVIDAAGVDPDVPELVAAAERTNQAGTALNAIVEEHTARWLDAGRIVGILGGDHSVPFGAIKDAAERHPGLGVLHVDAHADLREAFEGFEWSHASIFHNVLTRIPEVGPISQVGLRDVGTREAAFAETEPRCHWFTDAALAEGLADGRSWHQLCDAILAPLPQKVWISIDIDGLQPALCPSTGTPVPGGLDWHQITRLLARLSASGRQIVGFDLVEVNAETEWDAIVGARLLYKLAGHALLARA